MDASSLTSLQSALNQCKKIHDTCEVQATVYGEATLDMDTFLAMKPDAMSSLESLEVGFNLKADDVPACKELIQCTVDLLKK
jgi:tRNA-binding EMAP/Myf-like protein